MPFTLNDKSQLASQVSDYLKKLSPREKAIIFIAAAMVLVSIGYQIYKPINEAFIAQQKKQAEIQEQMTFVTTALGRYSRLKSRQAEIELAYKEVEIKEGALSHLENLVRNKAGIASGFTIRDKPTKEFGGNYEQAPFSIKFTITDFPRLVEFLKELVHGQHPMILASLDLKKRPAGDAIEAEMDVSSVRKVTRQNQEQQAQSNAAAREN